MEIDKGTIGGIGSTTGFHVNCPYCDRQEALEGRFSALAWVAGHIQAEHEEELPTFEGTHSDAD